LRDLGYVEGKNLVIEFRGSRTVEQMREAAAELARMKVDVIVVPSSTEAELARRATSTIPIVFVGMPTPWGSDMCPAPRGPAGT
jgi:putative ABC transport system substrate-binding protein